MVARRALLAIIGVIPIIGLLRYEGQRAGLYGSEVGRALMSVMFPVVMTAQLWVAARRTSVAERKIARLSRLYAQLSETR